MKPYIPYSLILAAASCGMAFGAATAYTTPVGYVSLGSPTGAALPDQTDIAVSIPLLKSSVFTGTVSSVPAANQITLSGTPTLATGPYIVTIESGGKNGLVAGVASALGDTLTVTLQPGDSLTSGTALASGDKISVRLATTVGNFLAGNTLNDGLELDAFSGITTGINIATDISFVYFGGDWYDSESNLANDVVLYPGESFILRNVTGADQASLVVSGEVPKLNSRAIISKLGASDDQDNRISYVSPVGEAIGSANLGIADGDQLIIFDTAVGINKSGASLFYFGGAWYDGESNDVSATFKVGGGEGYIYRRAASEPVGDVIVSDQQSYMPLP